MVKMVNSIYLLLFALAVLATKHVIFDFFLQTSYQWKNKAIYGHPGGLIHAGLGMQWGPARSFWCQHRLALVAMGIVAGEFLVHYHIDWC